MSVTGPAPPADALRAQQPRPRRRQDPAPAQGRARPDPGRRPAERAARAARDERARRRPPLRQPVAAQLRRRHRVLPARLVHDEVQPEAQRVGGPAARASPTCTRWPRTPPRRGRCSCCGSWRAPWRRSRGMRAVSLQPAAGAQGELTGILMIRAYHRARGDVERDEVLVPDSSHGTNPATASMAGFTTITVPSAADGGVDVDAFRAALGPRTAAVMITNPVDARPVRGADRRAARRRPRGRRARLHGRREPQRHPGPLQARRGRLRRHALQRPQDVQHAPRRRRSGRRSGRGRRAAGPVPAHAARPARRRRHVPPRASRGSDPRRSGGCAASSATRASSCARTRTSAPTAGPASPR